MLCSIVIVKLIVIKGKIGFSEGGVRWFWVRIGLEDFFGFCFVFFDIFF